MEQQQQASPFYLRTGVTIRSAVRMAAGVYNRNLVRVRVMEMGRTYRIVVTAFDFEAAVEGRESRFTAYVVVDDLLRVQESTGHSSAITIAQEICTKANAILRAAWA